MDSWERLEWRHQKYTPEPHPQNVHNCGHQFQDLDRRSATTQSQYMQDHPGILVADFGLDQT